MTRLAFLLALTFGLLSAGLAHAQSVVTVYAAASMTDALQEVGAQYEKRKAVKVRFSFSSSAVAARQIEAGAEADVFVSADQVWMDYLADKRLIRRESRRDLVGNRLVLIAPRTSKLQLALKPGLDLGRALGGGRLAVGDPDSVPAGRYARGALTRLGAWPGVENRLARAENVRVCLTYVARGEAPLGVVYETDARSEAAVRIVGIFPADSHPPIVYPAALTSRSAPEAAGFLRYLQGAEARRVFLRHGFRPL